MIENIIRIIPAIVQQEAVKIGRVEMACYWLDGGFAETVALAYGKIDFKRQKRWKRCKVPHAGEACGACGWRAEFKGADLGARRRGVILGTEKWLKANGHRPAFVAELVKPKRDVKAAAYAEWLPKLDDQGFSALALAKQDDTALRTMLDLMKARGHARSARVWSL